MHADHYTPFLSSSKSHKCTFDDLGLRHMTRKAGEIGGNRFPLMQALRSGRQRGAPIYVPLFCRPFLSTDYFHSADDSSTAPALSFFEMPTNWTAENDRKFLLLILKTSVVKVSL